MKALAVFVVLFLCVPEVWAWLTIWDLWAVDQIAQGLLIAFLGAHAWRTNRVVSGISIAFGLARSMCVAIWPDASDSMGSICDAKLGFQMTAAALGAALIAVGRDRAP